MPTIPQHGDAPNPGPGRPKDPEKRKAILQSAKSLFISNGYANTSMDAIASAAGVSKLTVYSHFTDKDTLFSAAVVARCEEQMPAALFTLAEGLSTETALLNIARAFQSLVNSPESLDLHRLMVTLGTQDPNISQIFFEAGPQRLIAEMESVLVQIDQNGSLRIEHPTRAAEHFLNMIKGVHNFRLLVGCVAPADQDTAEEHVREVVMLFMRAYRPDA
ncbi:TetR family transcriptional regulator [Pseudomonas syringae pv. delphinii]|uniref:TetR family transcriptional regulator n=1 Tax=Pseudomonas syringae pv. delphinii TaxID=192088 RepID=A0A0N8RH35_9PSED|nr:TetR/AcrR family transcriptional regulator [Pseudomonas syringae group genomosp. 3]KPX27687.1 TetR family transcriptional regulator [Pseudomonas syringae pv. delphinii]RMP08309.1 TetR family transcriptional regulator [Pseudomonas syringae pv. delphinii]RMP27062.1 TetR family transcriptional regulator [Pseudomonas syringae pv. delphinii]RMQ20382.1 TetR family transcriptional regulator [Pseudomonas syringae pv. delphinii]